MNDMGGRSVDIYERKDINIVIPNGTKKCIFCSWKIIEGMNQTKL